MLTGLEKPYSGAIQVGGTPLEQVDNRLFRTRLGYQGPDPHLFSGTISQNVLYGINQTAPPRDAQDVEFQHWVKESSASGNSTDDYFGNWLDYRLVGAENREQLMDWYFRGAHTIGSDAIMYRRGLLEIFDPTDYPDLAADILEARKRIRKKLRDENLEQVVVEFNPDTYNRNATVAENILFGVSGDEDLRLHNLAAHPYLRATLERMSLIDLAIIAGGKAVLRLAQRIQSLPKGHNLLSQFDLNSEEDMHSLTEIARRSLDEDVELEEGRTHPSTRCLFTLDSRIARFWRDSRSRGQSITSSASRIFFSICPRT